MILGWMVYSILFGGLCVLAAHAMENAARVIGKPTRWIWFAAMAATLGPLAISMTETSQVDRSVDGSSSAACTTRVASGGTMSGRSQYAAARFSAQPSR